MTVTVASFTDVFPSLITTPQSQIQYWIDYAYTILDASRWLDQLDHGVGLFVAHKLTLRNISARNGGVMPGVVSSKSAGGLSVSYDTSRSTIDNAGSYNSTAYGLEFYELAMMIGSGGVQLIGDVGSEDSGGTGVLG